MLFRLGYGLPVHWLAKHSLFRWPFGGLLKRLGGIPVDRRAPQGAIRAIADEFARRDVMWLGVTPEGTRSYTDHWKSGFYQIARAAGVPCGLAYIDYGRKALGIETFVKFTGDAAADMERIQAFYADKSGRHPEQASQIRLRKPGASGAGGSERVSSGSPGG
jgi:1-acyl-sn-glycerol-3-phosphate acyltransferase